MNGYKMITDQILAIAAKPTTHRELIKYHKDKANEASDLIDKHEPGTPKHYKASRDFNKHAGMVEYYKAKLKDAKERAKGVKRYSRII